MKKAAIITLYGNNNYGNKLQNYAVQETLKKYNFEVENIINVPILNNKKKTLKIRKSIVGFISKGIIKKIITGKDYHKYFDIEDSVERHETFLEFNKYINNTKHFFSFANLKKFTKYDYYFVGSDQVWNPQFGGLSDLDLLTFTNKNKIAFCASFGVDSIPSKYKDKVKNALEKFKAISVREDKGKEIIKELIPKKDIEVLVDPTMLLSTEEWNKISKKPKMLDSDNYVLCYFLGELSENKKIMIERFAEKNNCEVINILDPKSKFYNCGPSEFIYLESHANYIFTDSFHSSVFAILYNNPFIVFNREGKRNNMNSRIITLLDKFDLKSRMYNENIKSIEEYETINYNNVKIILENERKKAFNFLKSNID